MAKYHKIFNTIEEALLKEKELRDNVRLLLEDELGTYIYPSLGLIKYQKIDDMWHLIIEMKDEQHT